MSSTKLNHLFLDNVELTEEAWKDLKHIDGSVLPQVIKAINKVAANPEPANEGGHGHPLRNTDNSKLAGFYKIKLSKAGIRIVYQTVFKKNKILVIIIAARADDYVYKEAERRIQKGLK